MSTAEQRQRLRQHYLLNQKAHDEWASRDYQYPPPSFNPLPDDLMVLECGALTRAGTACKLKAIYANRRCKWHGGRSTGPKTGEGKKRSSLNGFKPKKKRSHKG